MAKFSKWGIRREARIRAEAPACVYERAIEEPILPEAPIMQTMKGWGRRVRVGWRVGGGWEWWVRKADWMGWVPQLDGDMVILRGGGSGGF